MLVLKIILYYLAFMCIITPIMAAFFNNTDTENKTRFPWKAMRNILFLGVVLLIIAVILTIFC